MRGVVPYLRLLADLIEADERIVAEAKSDPSLMPPMTWLTLLDNLGRTDYGRARFRADPHRVFRAHQIGCAALSENAKIDGRQGEQA